MTEPATTSATGPRTVTARQRGVPPWLLWYTVVGGTVAWAIHLGLNWSVMELACLAPAGGDLVSQRGGDPGPIAWWLVGGGTVVPWLLAATAAACGLVVRRRQRRLEAAGALDELASGRIGLLLVVGVVLDLLALAAITGGGIALLVLEPCG